MAACPPLRVATGPGRHRRLDRRSGPAGRRPAQDRRGDHPGLAGKPEPLFVVSGSGAVCGVQQRRLRSLRGERFGSLRARGVQRGRVVLDNTALRAPCGGWGCRTAATPATPFASTSGTWARGPRSTPAPRGARRLPGRDRRQPPSGRAPLGRARRVARPCHPIRDDRRQRHGRPLPRRSPRWDHAMTDPSRAGPGLGRRRSHRQARRSLPSARGGVRCPGAASAAIADRRHGAARPRRDPSIEGVHHRHGLGMRLLERAVGPGRIGLARCPRRALKRQSDATGRWPSRSIRGGATGEDDQR